MLTTNLNSLKQELQLAPNAPGGMIEYRRALCLSFFYKFFLHVQAVSSDPIQEKSLVNHGGHDSVKTGRQDFELYPDRAPVGHPVIGISAFKHATGEATFVDDIPPRANELHAAYVYSTQPHARIKSIDASPALEADSKVVAFFSAKDIPGANLGGLTHLTDEFLFAKDHVHAFGQVIGVVVAEDHESARQGARRVKVDYEPLESIISLREAIEKKSFEYAGNAFCSGRLC
jgi:xanthine dehydrogenase/oxidase